MYPMALVQLAMGLGSMQRQLQPAMRPDRLQRLAIMMALLALGTQLIDGCGIYDLKDPMGVH